MVGVSRLSRIRNEVIRRRIKDTNWLGELLDLSSNRPNILPLELTADETVEF